MSRRLWYVGFASATDEIKSDVSEQRRKEDDDYPRPRAVNRQVIGLPFFERGERALSGSEGKAQRTTSAPCFRSRVASLPPATMRPRPPPTAKSRMRTTDGTDSTIGQMRLIAPAFCQSVIWNQGKAKDGRDRKDSIDTDGWVDGWRMDEKGYVAVQMQACRL